MSHVHSSSPAWRPVGTRVLFTVLLLTGVITTAHSQTESTLAAQEHQITGTLLPNGVGIDIAGIDPLHTLATHTYTVSSYVVTVTLPSGWQLRRIEQNDPGDGLLWRWILAFDTSKGPVDFTVDVGELLMHEGIQLVAREGTLLFPPVLRVQVPPPQTGLKTSTLLIIGLSGLVIVLIFRAGRDR